MKYLLYLRGLPLCENIMRALSVAMLSCGTHVGLAFAPCSDVALICSASSGNGGNFFSATGTASPADVVSITRRRSRRCCSEDPPRSSTRRPRATGCTTTQFLFSPEHGDHDGPIAVVGSNQKVESDGKKTVKKTTGGWGSWQKFVSQRTEQDQVLEKFCSEGGGTGIDPGLTIRTGQKSDMLSVSHLCVDTFRGPFEWYMLPFQLFQEFSFYGQINGRLGRVTRNDIQHSMVVAEDKASRKVVGFLEIGMLPKPTSSEESALLGKKIVTAAAARAEMAAARAAGEVVFLEQSDEVEDEDDSWKDAGKGDSDGVTAIQRAQDVAYLANVVVDRNQRRRGIGRTMVSSAMELVRELWPAEKRIYVTVEQGNDIAVALYEGMGFELTAVEDEILARSRKRPPRVYLSKSLES